jgi:hypothetical protein
MSINQYTRGTKRLDFYCNNLTAEKLTADEIGADNLQVTDTITSGRFTSTTPSSLLLDQTGLNIANVVGQSLVNSGSVISQTTTVTGLTNTGGLSTSTGVYTNTNKTLVGVDATGKVTPSFNIGAYRQVPNWRYKANYNTVITTNLPNSKPLLNIKVQGFFARTSYVAGTTEIRCRVSSPNLEEFFNAELVSIKGSANPYLATDSTGQIKHPILLATSDATFITTSNLEVRFPVINPNLWYPLTPIGTIDDVAINLDIYIKLN